MAGDKDSNDAELGRSKSAATPKDHLMHLLAIGWNPRSPLIQKYAITNGLTRDLEEAVRDAAK